MNQETTHTAEQVTEAAETNEHPIPLRIRGMLRAYATALAQNAQGEAVACPKCGCEHGVAHAPYWNHEGDWTADAIWVCDKCDGERSLHLDLVAPGIHAGGARVPDGWVLVPREPSRAMLDATDCAERLAKVTWEKMLAAAPSHPEDASHE